MVGVASFFSTRISAILFCLAVGLISGYSYVDKSFNGNEYENQIGQQIDIEGIVAEDPVLSVSGSFGGNHENQQLVLLPDGYKQLIKTSLYTPIPDVKKGDRVWIRGLVQLPENFSEFDYIGFLQLHEVYAMLKKPRVIVLHRAPANWRTPLLSVRDYFVAKSKMFPQKEGSIILGMLIGQRQNIPEDVSLAFKRTGLTHVVAVSGFNMTIIATAVGSLVWYLGRRATNILTLVVTFAFVVVTGATAAVVRAAIMAVLMVTAQLLGRQYTSLYALLLVCAIMVLQNPRIVMWDIGFQLSVGATFGVLVAFKIQATSDMSGKTKSYLGEALRPTLGAIAFTAPIIAINFQTFSIIAPVANLVVLPFVSWIMLLGALAYLPIVGGAFVYPAQLLTSLVIFLTEKFSSIPFASITMIFPLWVWGVYYVCALVYVYVVINRQLPKQEINGKL